MTGMKRVPDTNQYILKELVKEGRDPEPYQISLQIGGMIKPLLDEGSFVGTGCRPVLIGRRPDIIAELRVMIGGKAFEISVRRPIAELVEEGYPSWVFGISEPQG